MIFKTSMTIDPIKDYFLEQQAKLVEYYMSVGHMESFARALTDYDEETAGAVWAEVDNKPVGMICFNHKDLSKRIMIINFVRADSKDIEIALHSKFEEFSKELNCVYINEAVSLKDVARISNAEERGFVQDFYFLFKRV